MADHGFDAWRAEDVGVVLGKILLMVSGAHGVAPLWAVTRHYLALECPRVADRAALNRRLFVWDTICWGVLAGTSIAFLPVLGVRMGVPDLVIGTLSAAPALVGALWMLPVTTWNWHPPFAS